MINTMFLIVGGGIAGVSCAETIAFLCPEVPITLLTQSSLIKAVTNLVPLGKSITKFDVEERDAVNTFSAHKSVQIVQDTLKSINIKSRIGLCLSGLEIKFQYLCVCTGGKPKLISQAKEHNHVIAIRDTESVSEFQKKITHSRRIIIVGNGGIASELVHEVTCVEIIWVIRDKHISATFVDPGASEFFQSKLNETRDYPREENAVHKRMRYCEDNQNNSTGAALGPDWHNTLNLLGANKLPSTVTVHYECEITKLENGVDEWPVFATLSNGLKIGCDLIVSATGVLPEVSFLWDEQPVLGPDGSLSVNEMMQTSIPDVYAAGDACYANWKPAEHWFQMRLWSQARQMGSMAAKAMVANFQQQQILQDFCFEMFSHVTKLFGYKVVLLGKYNGQGLNNQYEAIVRITPNSEYIKLILVDGKLQGAVLIGETGLEETFENLILNQLDVSMYGEDLLNPNIDIEDYFD